MNAKKRQAWEEARIVMKELKLAGYDIRRKKSRSSVILFSLIAPNGREIQLRWVSNRWQVQKPVWLCGGSAGKPGRLFRSKDVDKAVKYMKMWNDDNSH
jgi:hypothetical protein